MWQKIWKLLEAIYGRDDGEPAWYSFLMPELTTRFLIRLVLWIGGAYVVFGILLTPCVIDGASMEPTVRKRGVTLCWRWHYSFEKPKYGDVVIVRYVGKTFFLKRIVGLPGDTIAFRDGVLIRNGKAVQESYVRFPSDWNLPERKVEPGHVYVVGDNRSMPLSQHKFGQVSEKRLYGVPLWLSSSREASAQ
ncbi:MAG: signal peptidase I [Victivallaceae bacterium]|nr:signal peptidase I [Victivallaceae bacterium]